jgi:hypothetical protein
LATVNPKLASEWHPTKNGKLTPYDVTYVSLTWVWWLCKDGHIFKNSIAHRNRGDNCPQCNGIVLKGNVLCASIPEACMHIKYETSGIKFKHNKLYDKRFGKHRYDFYLIDENKYVETTSFTRESNYGLSQYVGYLREIIKKKIFVEDVLGAEFEFIQFTPSKEQVALVRKHQK